MIRPEKTQSIVLGNQHRNKKNVSLFSVETAVFHLLAEADVYSWTIVMHVF